MSIGTDVANGCFEGQGAGGRGTIRGGQRSGQPAVVVAVVAPQAAHITLAQFVGIIVAGTGGGKGLGNLSADFARLGQCIIVAAEYQRQRGGIGRAGCPAALTYIDPYPDD